jgi:hypothetical protein
LSKTKQRFKPTIAMNAQNTLSQLSRRKWLRDMALAATSTAMLPSLLTGCTDHPIPPTVGIGDVPLTNAELKAAAQNLLHMNAWIMDLYPFCIEYEVYMYALLKSGEKPSAWKEFVVSILTDIAIGIIAAAADVLSAGIAGAAAIAVLAIAADSIKTWALGDRPGNLDAEFAEFVKGHNQMQKAISDLLLILADETDNYKNLREGWKGDIDFNGKKYTLRDLAESQFPTVAQGKAYTDLRTAAYDQFRKYIWNLMIAKAGSIEYSSMWYRQESFIGTSPTNFGRSEHYKNHPATYLRGWYDGIFTYYYRYWHLTFDGRELPDAAAKELFKDDTPHNIINPDGLFLRDYVFKQFHTEKPDFFGYHDLKKHFSKFPQYNTYLDFDLPDDFEFTGGDFPQLIKK